MRHPLSRSNETELKTQLQEFAGEILNEPIRQAVRDGLEDAGVQTRQRSDVDTEDQRQTEPTTGSSSSSGSASFLRKPAAFFVLLAVVYLTRRYRTDQSVSQT